MGPIGKLIERLTKLLALFAGIVLLAIAFMTTISIIGRSLIWAGLGPIPGDFELVEMGAAVAVFGLLPYCHLSRGHVTVDILVNSFPDSLFNFLTMLGDLAIAVIAIIVAWRLWFGFQERITYGDASMILGAPIWVAYMLCFIGAVWMVLVGIYVLVRDVHRWRSGERLI